MTTMPNIILEDIRRQRRELLREGVASITHAYDYKGNSVPIEACLLLVIDYLNEQLVRDCFGFISTTFYPEWMTPIEGEIGTIEHARVVTDMRQQGAPKLYGRGQRVVQLTTPVSVRIANADAILKMRADGPFNTGKPSRDDPFGQRAVPGEPTPYWKDFAWGDPDFQQKVVSVIYGGKVAEESLQRITRDVEGFRRVLGK